MRSHPKSAAPSWPIAWAMQLLFSGLSSLAAEAATYYVDNQNPAASDANPGTQALPYRTITAAAAAHHGPGTVILVNPGTYRETVAVPASGDSASLFTYRAVGLGAVVDGCDDFSTPSKWVLQSGTVYLAATVTWNPLQVFVDGERLTPSTAGPTALPANSFQYVAGAGLYVNLDGEHPGAHQTTVGRRANGFRLSNVSWVEVDGFIVAGTEDRGVYLTGASSCKVRNNIVVLSRKYGIYVGGGTSNLIERNTVSDHQFHGIGLVSGATNTTVQDNESFRNADPAVRVANGLFMSGATGNLIRRNRWHDNQDSGEQLNALSDDNLEIQNVSWNNGDRGFDHLDSKNSVMIGCVAYGNTSDGIGFDGMSTGSRLHDCIAANNGLTTGRYDLSISSTASPGFQSDYNLFWNSTSQGIVKYNLTSYTSIVAFRAASGTDAHTFQADPRFANPAFGDFHLLAGSPAIDDADSGPAGWPPTDADLGVRLDDPSTPNTGIGPVAFADRGAYEYHPPPNQPPSGTIDSPPADVTIAAGQAVNFTGSGTDPDNHLPMSFAWSFGGGAPGTTAGDPGAVIFATPGTYAVEFTVFDALGLADPTPATRTITVTEPPTGVPADEIHWTLIGPNAVTLDWRGFDNTVRYGLTPEYGSTTIAASPTPIPFSSPGPFWEARITGLEENTVYHYSIGNGPDHTFRTPPPRGSSGFTIFAAGDIGSSADFDPIAALQATIAADHPAFVLMVGDLTYGNSTRQSSVDQHFNDVMAWSQDAAYMPAWGNHEWETPDRDDLRNYRGRFDLPHPHTSPGSPDGGGEDWSWFDYGNVRFIAYPEPYNNSSWPEWRVHAAALMDQAQADPLIRFVVTFGHRPPYSSGYHSGEAIRAQLDALGSTHNKYVLNLDGHSHNYERSYPQQGVVHVTAGTGGAELEVVPGPCMWKGGCPPPEWSAFRAMHHVSVRLRFHYGGILGEAICGPAEPNNDMSCEAGSIVDSFVIGTLDDPPAVTAPATAEVDEGGTLALHVSASDPDGSAIASFVANGLPAGAAFTAGPGNASGTLSWAPAHAQAGTYDVTFAAANALADSATTRITVRNVDRAPVVTAPATAAGVEEEAIAIVVSASDPDGEPIGSLIASELPSGATFAADQAGGTLEWTPGVGQEGVYTVSFTAANALSGSATTTLSVRSRGAPRVTAPATAGVFAGELLTVSVTATDLDHERIMRLAAAPLPSGATFEPGPHNRSGTLTWTPTSEQVGSYGVTFAAENSLSGTATTQITVRLPDRPPVISAPADATVQAGTAVAVQVAASDPDGDPIASLGATLPPAAAFAAASGNTAGTLTWIPAPTDVGKHTVTFTAANALSGAASIKLTVLPPNQPPVPEAAVSPTFGNEPLTVTADASASEDPDGSVASYTFVFGDGTTLGPQPGATANHTYAAGTWSLSVTVTDNQGAAATETTPVMVGWAPTKPNLIGNSSFEAGTENWGPLANATLQRVAGGFDGSWAMKVTGPATAAGFGCNDSPNSVASIPAAGTRYRCTAWIRAEGIGGTAKVQVREYSGAVKVGESLSNAVSLSPWWQMLSTDYVTVAPGTSLDFNVLDSPLGPGEVFLADNLSIFDVTEEDVLDVGETPPDLRPLVAIVAPSPLRSSATLSFVTSRPGPLEVTLFDIRGRRARTVMDRASAPAGFHVAAVDGKDDRGRSLPSGLYFYRIRALEGVSTGKILVAR